MMIALGVVISPAIRIVQRHFQQNPLAQLPTPEPVGRALVWLTGIATAVTVLNLAIRGLGAPRQIVQPSGHGLDVRPGPAIPCSSSFFTLALLLSVGLRYRVDMVCLVDNPHRLARLDFLHKEI